MTIVSYNSNFVFIHIPKCGGTSIEVEWERPGLAWGDYVIGSSANGETLHPIFMQLYGLQKHSEAASLRAVLGESCWARFDICALVREPRKIVESHYKYALTILYNTSKDLIKQRKLDVSYMPAAAATVRATLKHQDLASLSPLDVRRLTQGAVLAAMQSSSFAEYLERVVDDRWKTYLRARTHDAGGKSLVNTVLKLEQPDAVQAYFRKNRDPNFNLIKSNASANVETPWDEAMLRKFYDITQDEYLEFGYAMP